MLILIISMSGPAQASADEATFISRIIWRGDGLGDYTFAKNANMSGTRIGDDGAVEHSADPGVYEFAANHSTAAMITGASVSYEFTGEVALQISASGSAADYVEVVNGVPLEWGKFGSGSNIKWRATLKPGSRLTEVSIIYTDINSVVGSFGNPALSGFMFRKPLYIESKSDLFQHQVPIIVGESKDIEGCDLSLAGVIQSDFADVRFTLADQETLVPHYKEEMTEDGGQKTEKEKFWVKIPQIPEEGLLMYLYYGKVDAEDLSNGEAVFTFFDDFSEDMISIQKWSEYDFGGKLVEYKAKASEEAAVLETEGLTNEEIMALFTPASDYEWLRARKIADPAPAVDREATAGAQEEVPNLAQFSGVTIAPNGDLALEEMQASGAYISQLIYAPFDTRIMVPSWITEDRGQRTEDGAISIDISAKEYAAYKKDCENGEYYYASKDDFAEGSELRWRARISGTGRQAQGAGKSLNKFALDFRPGAITLTSPDGGEKVLAGSEYEIQWSAWEYEESYRMKLEYSDDDGNTYNIISGSTANDGKHNWNVPAEALDATKCYIRISDALDSEVFDLSNSAFSIVETLDEEGAEEEAEEEIDELLQPDEDVQKILEKYGREEMKDRGGAQLYEILVKIGGRGSKGGYEDGDIVMIKPAGHLWGASERAKFKIVQAYLTPDQVARLMSPGSEGADGDIARRRMYKLDMTKPGALKERVAAMKGFISSKPLVSTSAIIKK